MTLVNSARVTSKYKTVQTFGQSKNCVCHHCSYPKSVVIHLPVGNTLNVAAIASSESAQPLAGQELRKAKMARHASFSITPTSVAVQRQVSSAPSSPRREVTGKRLFLGGVVCFPSGGGRRLTVPEPFFKSASRAL